jgi:putative chitinase
MKTENLNRSLNPAIMGEVFSIVEKFNITNHLRLAHFLSQCAHESGNFKFLTENLNYSADGLLKIFPKYFKDKATADAYARKPEKIASRVYANRMGNGDEASGDGFKFRGRGYIQLTGKDNYKQFSEFIGEDCVANPDLVATKYPLTSAAFFFNKNGLWTICDKGDTPDVVTLVTKRVNGGTHGLEDRLSKFNTFNTLLA